MLLQQTVGRMGDFGAALTDFFWPHTCLGCGRLLASYPPDDVFVCTGCRLELSPLPPGSEHSGGLWATHGYDGPVASAVRNLKFHGQTSLAGPLAHLLVRSPVWTYRWSFVVPVPLHPRRFLLRGFNQAEVLARFAARLLRSRGHTIALHPRILRRTRATRPQTDLPAGDRLANVASAFCVPKRFQKQVQNARILVLDDVTTTGATLTACRQALEQAGAAQTCGLALLRALP